ncbi:hypothetical protein ACFQY7_44065 [Actinomadura luteofluorescens]|uniref:hypothetical protein n=1 Tax=Actinomadura luteofluorescens TaxID=46163 RepID=UPI0036261796
MNARAGAFQEGSAARDEQVQIGARDPGVSGDPVTVRAAPATTSSARVSIVGCSSGRAWPGSWRRQPRELSALIALRYTGSVMIPSVRAR